MLMKASMQLKTDSATPEAGDADFDADVDADTATTVEDEDGATRQVA